MRWWPGSGPVTAACSSTARIPGTRVITRHTDATTARAHHHAIPHHRRTCSAHAHNAALNGTDQLQIEMDGEVVISYTIPLDVAGRFRAARMPLGILWPFRQRPRMGRYRHLGAESGTEDAIYLDRGG